MIAVIVFAIEIVIVIAIAIVLVLVVVFGVIAAFPALLALVHAAGTFVRAALGGPST